MKRFLQSFSNIVLFTSKCWTFINTNGYILLTVCYTDNSWTVCKKILNFSFLPYPYNGVAIVEKIPFLLKDWGIDKNVMCLTVDNASSNDICIDVFKSQLKLMRDGDYLHVHYYTDVPNLIVKEGLEDVHEAVFKVKECVKYFKSSQGRK